MDIDREELLQVFATDANEHLDTLERNLLKLERSAHDPELLEELFRAAHTLKGDAGVVQLTSIAAFTHSLEGVLEGLRKGAIPVTSDLVSLLLRVVDAFRRIVPLAMAGVEDPQPEHAELVRWLEARRYDTADPAPHEQEEELSEESNLERSRTSLAARAEHRTLRVDVRKLDRMLDLVGEITIARGRLAEGLAPGAVTAPGDLREAHHDADRLYIELQEELMRARMVPLGPTFRRYARVVRDLALLGNKQADLVIEGDDVAVDLAVVEGVRDPLTHMIRNAVGHGIEPPEVRRAAGKPPYGTIHLRARHVDGAIHVSVSDDGKGLDRARILARARALKMVGETEEPSDATVFKLIFAPGFSTAESVTSLSGRGVGMDVVQRNVEQLRGSVSVASEAGKGTTITLRLPLTLAIIDGFSVGVGDETFVLPLDSVVECVELPVEERAHERAEGVVQLRGRALPYLRLGKLFDLPRRNGARESLVVLQHDGGRAGLAVDVLRGTSPTMIKALAPLVDRAPAVAGCAILGSGRIALILDVPTLLQTAVARAAEAGDAPSQPAAPS